MNLKYKEKVCVELDKMLIAGIIEPVEESDWVSPMVVKEKKQKGEIRICMDLRKLNDACVHNPFSTLFTDEVLENVGRQEAYSFMDGFLGYHQIKMRDRDVPKTAFRCHYGHFESLVMPFGLTNAPATFQSCMNHVFRGQLRKFVLVLFDDILIYNQT